MSLESRRRLDIRGLLLAAAILLVSCSSETQKVEATPQMSAILTNAFHLNVPKMFNFEDCVAYQYSSMDGPTKVYLGRFTGINSSASNLLQELELRKITTTRLPPAKDTGPVSKYLWWRPYAYGECDGFFAESEEQKSMSLWGYICQDSTNCILFLQIRQHE
jgi:hypothetical protein